MAKIIKQTVVSPSSRDGIVLPPVKQQVSSTQTVERSIYFILGIIEVLLAFRLIFKLSGASLASSFVRTIYSLTALLVAPFEGIFHKAVAQGIETASVLEPSTLVALVVYAILAWGIVMLVRLLSREQEVTE
jgi:hypothetical protein